MNATSPTSRGAVAKVGRWSFDHPWRVILVSLLVLAGLTGLGGALGGEFRQNPTLPGSETQLAADRLRDGGLVGRGGYQGYVVITGTTGETQLIAVLDSLLAEVERVVDGVVVHRGHPVVSDDESVVYSVLDLGTANTEAIARAEEVREVREGFALPAGVVVELGGDPFVEEAEFSSEGVGLIAAVLILLVAFGSVLAMGLPIATALVGIGCAVAVIQLATRFIDIPPFTPGIVAMIGIGAGIDYALFIVTRYREEIHRGSAPRMAVERAMSTAGKAAVFAGATVVASLLGLLVIGLDDVRSVALAAASGVLFVMVASITLLPAILRLVGSNIDRFGLPHRRRIGGANIERSFWYRWSRALQRRPVTVTVGALIALVLLAAPLADLRLGLSDASNRPTTDTTRRAHDLISESYGAGSAGPLFLAVDLSESSTADLEVLSEAVAADRGVASVHAAVINASGETAFVQVLPTTGPQDPATTNLVHRLRHEVIPDAVDGSALEALVGGVAAATVDFADHSAQTLTWFIGVVLILSFLLLMVVFRSLLVPLKAVAVNLLSVGAAYGVIVAVFQWGWLAGPLGLGQPGPIEAWVPMMMFAIVFGLSMDYEVFLLSRIKEEYLRNGNNGTAVGYGIARTGRLITAAAAIMVCVFGAFVLSEVRALQMMGMGLAVAIAVDATVVRLILVPATMELLGDRNWWLPGWIRRRIPDVNFDTVPTDEGDSPLVASGHAR